MQTQNCIHTIATTNLPPPAEFRFRARRLLMLVLDWSARTRQRRDLAALNDHMLQDIGLTRADVNREISKPFWHP